MKFGRNMPCPCGSGRKFKRCCGVVQQLPDEDAVLREAMDNSIRDDQSARKRAVAQLLKLRNAARTEKKKNEIELVLVQALQKIGDHVKALEIIDSRRAGPASVDWLHLRARSLERLGRLHEAVPAFERLVSLLVEKDAGGLLPYALIEAGRAYAMAGSGQRALEMWRQSERLLEGWEDAEHLARVRSNIGRQLLNSDDPEERNRGEELLYETSDVKARIGDLEGMANNFSILSLYYLSVGRYERAIAFARRDLQLTRLIGDEHQLCATLGNLAIIYLRMKQLSPARRCLEEARAIGARLNHAHTLEMVGTNLAAVNAAGAEAGRSRQRVGEGAFCACNSGKVYNECCGMADFEPESPFIGVGESPGADDVRLEHVMPLDDEGRLDRVLADHDATRRFGWTTIHQRDGWLRISELPDVANYHLNAARSFAARAEQSSRAFDEPLAACVLSVCAAEAFINTVCFFIADTAKYAKPKAGSILAAAAALVEEPMAYQRRTELTKKWEDVGVALAGEGWVLPETWRAFVLLVSVRNELVHFKASDYEQVSPAPKHLHEILRRMPPEVQLRDVPHSWPARLLTRSFAEWCVATVEAVIVGLKSSYSSRSAR